MKKSLLKIIAATVFTFVSFTAIAQQASDRKPVIDESSKTAEPDKTSLPAVGPQIVTPVKAMTVNDKPKPIVPGGEFKPTETAKHFIANNTNNETAKPNAPVMPAPKKAGPPPVVTEMNAANAQKQTPAAPVTMITKDL